ncbi:High-affinity glucose transporter rgt2 [Irineochytrium annulatum]|nr:High-affinity glucose transporter rgt2 [Irineochytrium annulatum]
MPGVYNWVVAFAAGMGGLLFGYEIGVIGQVLGMDKFAQDFGMQTRNASGAWVASDNAASISGYITSTFLFGCVGGAAVFSVVADTLGRKYSIIIGGGLFAVGGLIQSLASAYGMLLAGRFISGLAIGTVSMVVPLYIAETAESSIRGTLTTIYQLMITFGIFVATAINVIIIKSVDNTSSTEWRAALGVQVAPAILLVILVYFIPLSPRWLAEKGRNEEGQAVIAKLRSLDVNDSAVIAEYDAIRQGVEYERRIGSASWTELAKKGIGRRVAIGFWNQVFQQLTGINVILYYSATIFAGMGFKHADTIVAFPLANAFINFVATFPGMYMIEKYGRKTLLVWGGLGMGIAHALVYAFLTAANNGNQSLAWGAVIAVYIFFFNFASTWGPVVWSYQAEIFPLRIRAKATGIATMTNWGANGIIGYFFPIVFAALNTAPTVYWIFASMGFVMCIYTYVFVPETMGKTLEEMDAVFGGSVPTASDIEIEAAEKK